jgi:hypothetical protein
MKNRKLRSRQRSAACDGMVVGLVTATDTLRYVEGLAWPAKSAICNRQV